MTLRSPNRPAPLPRPPCPRLAWDQGSTPLLAPREVKFRPRALSDALSANNLSPRGLNSSRGLVPGAPKADRARTGGAHAGDSPHVARPRPRRPPRPPDFKVTVSTADQDTAATTPSAASEQGKPGSTPGVAVAPTSPAAPPAAAAPMPAAAPAPAPSPMPPAGPAPEHARQPEPGPRARGPHPPGRRRRSGRPGGQPTAQAPGRLVVFNFDNADIEIVLQATSELLRLQLCPGAGSAGQEDHRSDDGQDSRRRHLPRPAHHPRRQRPRRDQVGQRLPDHREARGVADLHADRGRGAARRRSSGRRGPDPDRSPQVRQCRGHGGSAAPLRARAGRASPRIGTPTSSSSPTWRPISAGCSTS